MKNVYKIKHKSSGLFYKPATGYRWNKTNFSKEGKIYSSKPNLSCVSGNLSITESLHKKYKLGKDVGTINFDYCVNCSKDDWEIIKYELVLKEVAKS